MSRACRLFWGVPEPYIGFTLRQQMEFNTNKDNKQGKLIKKDLK